MTTINDINAGLAPKYYRLALSAASCGDLGAAASYARYALLFDEKHENAARLLCLCLYETGELESAGELIRRFPDLEDAAFTDMTEINDTNGQVSGFVKRGKWKRAARKINSRSHRSVRVLLILGCIYAASKKYRKASRVFAKALKKDAGNTQAASYLTESVKKTS